MKDFGETIRELRTAQDLGLRETAGIVGISPAYLSRIERGKETPPRPEIIKKLAKLLAADPDTLFRLSSSTDPEITDYFQKNPEVNTLVRFLHQKHFSKQMIMDLIEKAEELSKKCC